MLLTFDDGPDPIWTLQMIAALGDTAATFFVLGPAARARPQAIDALQAAGHRVELHGSAHLRHSTASAGALRRDTYDALDDLAAVGVHPTAWRVPWGVVTDETRMLADELGLALVGWTIDTHDWRGDCARSMHREIKRDLTEDSIVLMHDGIGPGARRDGCAETVRLVERLVHS